MGVAVDFDGLRRVTFDAHLADGPADGGSVKLAGPEQKVGGTAQATGDAAAGGDEQVEAAIGRIDGRRGQNRPGMVCPVLATITR